MDELKKLFLGSIIVGVIAGGLVTLYGILCKVLQYFFYGDFENIENWPIWYFYLVPTLSIFIVNLLIKYDSSVREYGVAEIAEMIKSGKIILSIKSLILKIIASTLSIASGFAVGNEGPSAAIGAMVAYQVNRFLKLSKEKVEVLISVGAASGISAIFVSPITGIAFALENIAYKFFKDFATFIILGGMIAFSIGIYFLTPISFEYASGKLLEWRYILSLFLFIPVISVFIYLYLFLNKRILEFLREKFSNSKFDILFFSLIGGFTIGTLLLISPYAVFSGHEVVEFLMNNKLHLPLYLLILIIILRIIASSVSIFSNAVGGIFIALMSIGALIGYGFAEVLNIFNFNIEPFYFASIGAAIFIGVNMKLPFTAVVLAVEITYDYNVVVPVGIGVAFVSHIMSYHFNIRKFMLFTREKNENS
ncbi:chloride channel protein [Caminibacter mediatlanticus TB-2]|uniref:Chloride channel protein n=1 Tax=Caminibacter mediatlanticus TB-2 TaxID=391592 RepID=A0ABX5VED6_9BACT|nr:chloride channel protein [Caminibacter mediatlanticus]QCT95306.1 chloride channel protein [Caminibacter mediatlanticus TB-2]